MATATATARIEWALDPERAWMPNYIRWVNGMAARVEMIMRARAPEIEQWLKENHPWQNRTHSAEEGLFAVVMRNGLIVSLIMGHDAITYYSRFLEKYMSPVRPGVSKWSVLAPALDYWGPILLEDVRHEINQ